MKFRLQCFFAIVLLTILQGLDCASWSSALKDGQVKYACVGETLTLPWQLNLTSGQTINDIAWYFHGQSEEMIAILSHGHFMPMPAFGQRVSQVGNAGIEISHLTLGETGNYSVEVSMQESSGVLTRVRQTVYVHVADDKCSSSPCQNGGQCVLVPTDSNGFRCICSDGFTGDHCETASTHCHAKGCSADAKCVELPFGAVCACPLGKTGFTCDQPDSAAVNIHAPHDKPHAVVPTPPGGSRIPCDVHTTCTIPIYTTGGGGITPGQHTPDIQTGVTPPSHVPTTVPPNSEMSTVSVTPKAVGEHRACFDVTDSNSGIVDTVCYTIVGTSTSGQTPHSTVGPDGGHFTDKTLPDGSTILCRAIVPCHLIATTHKTNNGQCVPVQAQDAGSFSFTTLESPDDGNTCDTDILIDPQQARGSPVCFKATVAGSCGGETRCYNVTTIAADKCSSNPCLNGGECVMITSPSLGSECVCPADYTGHLCETRIVVSSTVSTDQTTSGFMSTGQTAPSVAGTTTHMASNQVSFLAKLSSTLTTPSPGSIVVFDNVFNNLGNAYSSTTGYFTAPYSGSYFLALTTRCDSHHSMISDARIMSDNHEVCRVDGAVSADVGSCQGVEHLSRGQRVWVTPVETGACFGSRFSDFTGFMISADP